MNNFKVLHL